MKQKLPNIAKKNGFVAKMINPNEHAWYVKSLEPHRWLLWLTSLTKWFSDEHEIYVTVVPWEKNVWTVSIDNFDTENKIHVDLDRFETKEDALAQGLLEAFNHI
jgi:hypothetical protein